MSSDVTTDRPAGAAMTGSEDRWSQAVPSGDVPAPTLVIGLGNPILGDDGVGWRVIDELRWRIDDTSGTGAVELDRLSVGGLTLMERLVGYERAVIVDAVRGSGRPGTVWALPLQAMAARPCSHLDSAHDASLTEAIEAGRALGARLPDDITVVGIAVGPVDEFHEFLSRPVAAAVDAAAEAIVRLLTGRPERVV